LAISDIGVNANVYNPAVIVNTSIGNEYEQTYSSVDPSQLAVSGNIVAVKISERQNLGSQ
jgi:hypothetical protein